MTYELYHHGILGMRWGVRRFQNKDGSLTKAGEKRYATDKTIQRNKTRHHDGPDEYTIKKGSIATRVYTLGQNEGITKQEAEAIEKAKKAKYVSVDGMNIHGGENGKDFYADWFGLDGLEASNMNIDSYKFKHDVRVASGKQTMDYMVSKYVDMTVKDFLSENHIIPKDGFLKKDEAKVSDALVKNIVGSTGTFSEKDKFINARGSVATTVDKTLRMLTTKSDTSKELYDHYRKLGYEAFEDINDTDTDFPVRFIDAYGSLTKTGTQSGKDYWKKR